MPYGHGRKMVSDTEMMKVLNTQTATAYGTPPHANPATLSSRTSMPSNEVKSSSDVRLWVLAEMAVHVILMAFHASMSGTKYGIGTSLYIYIF